MQSLSRQQTANSTLSWWSDRNLAGATIDLHAASKPLMKFLYHRQALGFIEKNRATPLSKETLDIYSSYLAFKYIATSTKTAILTELCNRASQSADEARVVVDSDVLNQAPGLLESPEPQIRRLTCRMVGRLAYYIPTTSDVNPCVQLVSLLSDENTGIVAAAIQALGLIAKWPGGAQAAVDANILDHVAEWVKSPNPVIRQFPCSMMRQLARHKSTVVPVLALKPCVQIMFLLHDEDEGVVAEAIQTLCSLTKWPDGALAAMDAKILDHVAELFESPNSWIRQSTCFMVENLSHHVNVSANYCVHIVSLLRDKETGAVTKAMKTLYWLLTGPHTAQTVLQANMLDQVIEFLESPDAWIRNCTCWMVGTLARSTSNCCVPLVSLLRDEDAGVVTQAIWALSRIAYWPKGARAVVEAKTLDAIIEFLESRNPQIRQTTCELLGNLASHDSTALRILRTGDLLQLVSFLQRPGLEFMKREPTAIR